MIVYMINTRDFATLRFDVAEHVATITFTRGGEHNTFNAQMCLDILDAMDLADGDDDVRAVVVTGEGRSFCGGADLSAGFDVASDQSPARQEVNRRCGTFDGVGRDFGGIASLRFAASRTPVIGALNGSAVGIGITMTLPMDVRVLADSAKVGFVFARRGIVLEAASSWFLPRLVGPSKALEWCLTGRMLTAAEVHESGLVSYVVPADEVLAKAREIALEIAEHASPLAASVSRHLVWSMLTVSDPFEAHRVESLAFADLSTRPDVNEGVTAFFERRAPVFTSSVADDFPDYLPAWPPSAVDTD
ncbi:MAG: Enoyl-CoA hydratase/isomerase [Aeromicrobium sp.]|nr:Enoyl-CoA hydratase/isomerase [Aeromicrobium sp.]